MSLLPLTLLCPHSVVKDVLEDRESRQLHAPECPRNSASFISKLLFHWVTPFVWNGYKRDVTTDDLWALNEEDGVEYRMKLFRKHIEMEFPSGNPTARKDGERGSTLRALVKTFRASFLIAGVLKMGADVVNFFGPLIMKALMRFMDNDQPTWIGIAYAVVMLLSMILQTILENLFYHRISELGMHVRNVVTAAVYEKSLRLSPGARREKTVGEIVNLMSNDAQILRDTVRTGHMLWSTPVQIVAASALIYLDMGISVGAGLLFMLVMIPLSVCLATFQKAVLAAQMKDKDSRIKLMNEILNGMRVLKFYAWELGFKRIVDAIRSRELSKLRRIAYLQASLTMLWFFAPFAVTFVTFAAFVFLNRDQRLRPDVVFTALALYQNLRVPLTMLPSLISNFIQSCVSLKRLDDFLSANELEFFVRDASERDHAISMKNATFSWEGNEAILTDMSLDVPRGELLAIVGRVGGGKSSLISAMLGEMNLLSGKVHARGSVAYVSQQTWLRNATFRENILFGKPYDHQRYWDILRRCALLEDIEMLPAGDQTEIGEKGINLSGGQKQRVSIARAVYADADTYFMDDPLSAVDSHTGLQIFYMIISNEGMLKTKTRVFVTHGIQYLPKVDRMVIMENGRMSRIGNSVGLMRSENDFRSLMPHIHQPSEDAGRVDYDQRQSILRGEPVPLTREPGAGKIVSEELTESGRIRSSVYGQYLRAIGLFPAMIVMLTMFGATASQVGSSFWLNEWSKDKSAERGTHNLMIFGVLGIGQAVGLFFGVLSIALSSLSASRQIHDKVLVSILRAPMDFFDSTPIGRIMNRFAHDVEMLDLNLPQDMRVLVQQFLSLLAILFVICYNLPLFILVVIPIGIVYYLVQLLYITSSRQLRRLENISRSPIFSHFGETLQGSAIIRAFGRSEEFTLEFNEKIDSNASCYLPRIAANRWLCIRLDLCASSVTFATAVFVVLHRGDIDAGIAGLCLAYALQASFNLNAFIRSSADIEVSIVSVERLTEYISLESEAECTRNPPRNSWPSKGAVEFENYSTRYRENLPAVVRGINLKIEAGEKVGVCGRTGAGKSSMTLALFRIIEACEGRITIDDIPIADIGIHDLREKLSIIPQDPVLFSGALRLNLDPFEAYKDEELWHAVEHAHLKAFVTQQDQGLDFEVSEGGENLSVGQRQLVCLARALLRKSKILVLDEATAAVDIVTDSLIQETIHTEFAACTIITIAHRINTIMNYDKILVLEAGEVREYDSPQKLLADPNSLFSAIVADSGIMCSRVEKDPRRGSKTPSEWINPCLHHRNKLTAR
ncbi:canalicular multispecific organic anion transporter 2 [Galendromus occidentalis]|uniref:Canalicular multispecific organic anion transporter 2 n=1 Tax=Galendromus occidentalis TaxID=34638 RepID=A0AAJ7SDR1_9ACAR|nr:canalicular multispecific organic anion transporter 2 [Galendromus occidentalis]